MIYGYRSADTVQLWQPPAFLRHINNLLMLIAVILLNLGMSRGVEDQDAASDAGAVNVGRWRICW